MLEVHIIHDDELRVARLARHGGTEESKQRAVGPQHPRQLRRELLRRGAVEIIDHVPAQDAVDRPFFLRKALLEERRQMLERVRADMAIDVGENVLDKNLATELLAEKAHVAPDDRAKIQQHRRFACCQRGEKFLEGFGGENRIVGGDRRRSLRTYVRLALTRRDAV